MMKVVKTILQKSGFGLTDCHFLLSRADEIRNSTSENIAGPKDCLWNLVDNRPENLWLDKLINSLKKMEDNRGKCRNLSPCKQIV